MPPLGPIDSSPCCGGAPGTYPPPVSPYVVSLNGLSGILVIDGQGGITVSAVGGTLYLTLSAAAGLGTVTSVAAASLTTALTITGSPIETAGTLQFQLAAPLRALAALLWPANSFAYVTGAETFANATISDFSLLLLDDPTAAAMRTTLGATTLGANIFSLTNPSAITWLRVNADNTVTARTAAETRTDLGLVIGTNVQAWSADLDAFVTNAVWTGSNLAFSGEISAAMSITGESFVSEANPSTGADLIRIQNDSDFLFQVFDNGQVDIHVNNGVDPVFRITQSATEVFKIVDGGDATFSSAVVAQAFAGDGQSITNLDAGNIAAGTLSNARLDADIAALGSNGTNGFWARTGAGTGAARTITGSAAFTITNGAGIAGNPLIELTNMTGSGSTVFSVSPSISGAGLTAPTFDKLITPAGTTGNRTINYSAGTVNFAAAATSLLVTSSLVTANSIVLCQLRSNDASAVLGACVPTTGSFTIYMATPPTAETSCGFLVIN